MATGDNTPEAVMAAMALMTTEKRDGTDYDYSRTCMLFTKAEDVPPRPPFPTEDIAQETADTRSADGTPTDRFQIRLSFHRGSLWPNGSVIRVLIADGTPESLQTTVRQYVQLWTEHANLRFEFVDSGPSDIRITFNTKKDSSWSLIGTQCRQRDQREATMNLGIDENTPPHLVRAEILHEFGHALGAIHEHQSPLANIPWNRFVVYDHYKSLGKSNDWVDQNIFNQPFPTNEIDADYDTDSIMIYPYLPSFTLDGSSVNWVTELSLRDRQRIASIYPLDEVVVSNFATNHPTETPMEWESINFQVTPHQSAPPQIASALSMIDMSNSDENLRVRTQVTDIGTDRFTVGVGTWGNRIFYNGGVSLLRVPAQDANFRMGTLRNVAPNSYRVEFQPPFTFGVLPNVFAAFSGIDAGGNWRGSLDVHQVNHAQCYIQVSTWGSSNLYSADVQWIAYPSTLSGIEIGTFSSEGPGSGTLNLRTTFISTPSVFMGFQYFDINSNQNARLRVQATAPNPNQVTWAVETWANSVIYKIIGIFIAISSSVSSSQPLGH
ncbi:hypothetical protein FPRO05_14312 [Fusarium proliferatum]|uniref:Peptidase metallopeptidase domain-containing protein n=1 Tax=Gibberella intermedia TaxID=948311 RepID=A0A365MRF3_GIBIN|nr:hypothetical protein FPRO05_14312 [Fusarium proliferatum]